MTNKTVYVKSDFDCALMPETSYVATGVMKSKFFGGEREEMTEITRMVESSELSDSRIDGTKLNKNLNKEIKQLNDDGYEVISITPISSGNYNYHQIQPEEKNAVEYGFAYGYSYTEGMIILARKEDQIVKTSPK